LGGENAGQAACSSGQEPAATQLWHAHLPGRSDRSKRPRRTSCWRTVEVRWLTCQVAAWIRRSRRWRPILEALPQDLLVELAHPGLGHRLEQDDLVRQRPLGQPRPQEVEDLL